MWARTLDFRLLGKGCGWWMLLLASPILYYHAGDWGGVGECSSAVLSLRCGNTRLRRTLQAHTSRLDSRQLPRGEP